MIWLKRKHSGHTEKLLTEQLLVEQRRTNELLGELVKRKQGKASEYHDESSREISTEILKWLLVSALAWFSLLMSIASAIATVVISDESRILWIFIPIAIWMIATILLALVYILKRFEREGFLESNMLTQNCIISEGRV